MPDYNAIHDIYNEDTLAYFSYKIGLHSDIYNLSCNYDRLYSIIGLINLAGYQYKLAGQDTYMDQDIQIMRYCNGNYCRLQSDFSTHCNGKSMLFLIFS